MRYEAVLFDMDGTVLDTLEDLFQAVNVSLGRFGLPPAGRERVRACLGNGAARLIAGCVPEGAEPETVAEVLAFYQPYYASHCRINTRPYDGIVPLMQRLRAAGVKLAVVSNKPDGAVKELAEAFFPGLLASAVGESQTVARKPDPAALLAAIADMGADPGRCVYVGDSEVDLLTAKNAGLPCISVTWGFRDEEQLLSAGAACLARSVSELELLL